MTPRQGQASYKFCLLDVISGHLSNSPHCPSYPMKISSLLFWSSIFFSHDYHLEYKHKFLKLQLIIRCWKKHLVIGHWLNRFEKTYCPTYFALSFMIGHCEWAWKRVRFCHWDCVSGPCFLWDSKQVINYLDCCCFIKQMVNAIACTIELWYTREVAKHERSVRVARGDSRVRL